MPTNSSRHPGATRSSTVLPRYCSSSSRVNPTTSVEQVLFDSGDVAGGLDVAVLPLDLPVGADHEGGADDPLVLLAVVLLLPPHPEGLGERVVLVRQEGEGQAFLLAELGIALRGVGTDSDDLVAGGEEVVVGVAEVACLCGATGSHRLRIEEHD